MELIPLGKNGTVEAALINAVYQSLASEGISLSDDKIPTDVKIAAQTGLIKKKPVASVSLVPIRRNPVTGKMEKLVEFDLIIFVKPAPQPSYSYKRSSHYASNSVLKTGTWYKIAVNHDGIFKLDYNFLKNLGLNVDGINPRNIRIYGNGGGMLPEENAVARQDDLAENAIYVTGETDGRFDPGDYVLFYGQSPHRWYYNAATRKFTHQTNLYSDSTYYFINADIGAGKRWTVQASLSNPDITVTTFDDYAFHEKDESNLLHSGREWYGEYFSFSTASRSFTFNFPNLEISQPVILKSSVAARSISQTSNFTVTVNGIPVNQHSITRVGSNYTDTYAKEDTRENTFFVNGSPITAGVTFANSSSSAEGWLNYIEVIARSNLVYNGSPLIFRDKNSVGAGKKAEFIIRNAPSGLIILDVTNPANVFSQQYALSGNEARFTVSTDSLREFIAFVDGFGLSAAAAVGLVGNQDLHAIGQPDMIIVAHSSLLNEARSLANHHQTKNNLAVEVVSVEKIFNEFASGIHDITAIRDFLRMMYDRAGADTSLMPRYLLLFGDGSFDYKDRVANNTNLVPTYQSPNSLDPISTFVSDDYFGFLDETEGGSFISGAPDYLDIAIGRLPVTTSEEAQNIVNKIIHYQSDESSSINPVPGCSSALDQSNSVFGNWRNVITFIGDDEDGNIHMRQANDMADYFVSNFPEYNIDKIYLDAYQQQSTPGGSRYPDVNEAISKRIFAGTLIMNYTGHGGVNGWAHERILDISGINAWNNIDKLPLFITATCEFSKFDDPQKTSAGEMVLLNANGGAIAMVTTTRLVFSGANFELNNNFLRQAFTPLNNRMPTFGEAVMLTKNLLAATPDANSRKFTLLGDPSVMLAYPRYNVATTEINNEGAADDTLQALKKVTIKGEVRDEFNNRMTGFNGIVYPTIFDKSVKVTTIQNDGGSAFNFNLQKSILYNGKASVSGGVFSFTFIVPKDIAYNIGQGKISYYADNGTIDANGYTFMMIGGTATDFKRDDDGPQIDIFLNDEKFFFGGITNQNPLLLVKLNDTSGINTVGTGIGHDVTAVLDDNSQKTFVLNEYYKADLDKYTSGRVEFPLSNLEDGRHSLKVKAWDVFNNSSEAYTEFVVADDAELALNNVLNYPNPFTSHTSFLFEHNCPCKELLVTIKIMTVSGKVVKTISQEVISDGFRIDKDMINWDGLDEYGETIGRGVYVYKLNVRTPDGKSAQEFAKLVILR